MFKKLDPMSEEIEPINTSIITPFMSQSNSPTKVFNLIQASELALNKLSPKWLINHLIPEKGIVQIFGKSGTYKSFLALDMAYCIANGIPWQGKEVTQGTVIYIAGEGFNGLTKRIQALEIHYGLKGHSLYISNMPINLMNETNVKEVANIIKNYGDIAMIIIDTLHRNSGGANENASDDASRILLNIDKYFSHISQVTCWVHHTGHSEQTRSRGSSSYVAAVDTNLFVSRSNNVVKLECLKQKDDEEHEPMTFQSQKIELDYTDNEGQVVSSLVLSKSESNSNKTNELTQVQRAIFNALKDAIKIHGESLPYDLYSTTEYRGVAVQEDHWKEFAFDNIIVNSTTEKNKLEAKRKKFSRAKDVLADHSLIANFGNYYTLSDNIDSLDN